MKRSMLILLAVLMLLLAPATQLRANAAETGTCGENLTWTLDDAGTLTISGTGAMYDYSGESLAPWYSQREAIQSVVVEDGVTTICDAAFTYCTSLSSITIPDSVTSIGVYAFSNCTALMWYITVVRKHKEQRSTSMPTIHIWKIHSGITNATAPTARHCLL